MKLTRRSNRVWVADIAKVLTIFKLFAMITYYLSDSPSIR